MPIFCRSSFGTPRKTPRRNKSLPNILQLDDSLNFTYESMKLDSDAHAAGTSAIQSSLIMKLGDASLSFDEGQWSIVGGKGMEPGSMEYTQLQKQSLKVVEENNLLKYKVELLLDMLAASNADCIVLQKELEAVKKQSQQRR